MKEELQHKIDFKTKPLGSLGTLELIALQIGLIQKSLTPAITNPTHIVFAGDHGLADEGVSLYPKEVTFQMVMNFLMGGAAINVFCTQHNITLKVVDAGVDFDFPESANLIQAKIARGTKSSLQSPAMTIDQCRQAIERGREIVQAEYTNGCNYISFGEMGIGNTSSAALLMHAYTGIPIEDCVGRGTGHDEHGVQKKLGILQQVVAKHSVVGAQEILACFGGFEIAMMCGAMLQAKQLGMAIVIDGFITTSALLAAHAMQSDILDNCIFSHCSNEQGHVKMLNFLGGNPIVDLGMRLGEGTGAVVVYPIIQSSVLFLNNMASFESAGVSNKD